MVRAVELDNDHAETIVELFNQLSGQGYAAEDLRLVHRGYALAAPLYTCQYRSSGRSLIDHAVSTASTVAALAAPTPLVAATLLHAVYLHGDFGTRLRRVSADQRARVRRTVGDAAEEILDRYTAFEWTAGTISAVGERLPAFDEIQRQVVLMRLADQLDIYGTRDGLYCNNLAQRRNLAQTHGPVVVAMAEALGFPTLSAALARAYGEFGDLTPPAALASPPWRDGVIVPRSYRIRASIAVYQRARATVWRVVGR